MNSLDKLEKEVRALQLRNKTVEIEKAWETSGLRRTIVFFLTYLAIGIYMWAIEVKDPWLNAIIPAVGFWLSTLTLPLFKKLWEKYFFTNKLRKK